MKSVVKKFKNIIGMNAKDEFKLEVNSDLNTNQDEAFELKENVDKVEEMSSRQFSIEPDESTDEMLCDVCKSHTVIKKSMNLVKIFPDGKRVARLDEPRITYINGDNRNGVVMCDECLNQGDTEDKANFIWIAGMVNIIEENIENTEAERQKLYESMEAIKVEAESKIQELLNIDAEKACEVSEMKVNLEQLIQHQQILGNKIDAEMGAMQQESVQVEEPISIHA